MLILKFENIAFNVVKILKVGGVQDIWTQVGATWRRLDDDLTFWMSIFAYIFEISEIC